MAIRIEPPLTKEKLDKLVELAREEKRKQRSNNLRKLFGKGSSKKIDPVKLQKKMRDEWN